MIFGMFPAESPRSNAEPSSRPSLGNDRSCACATQLEQVESAWRLVHDRYAHAGLIHPNRFGIHAVPCLIGPQTCVVFGPDDSHVDYTMTLCGDNPKGLALDSVYSRELNEIRERDGKLLEVGMLAEREYKTGGSGGALFGLMRWAVYYGLHTQRSDIVIGVHPRHARFYARSYGFKAFATPTNYPLVCDRPVVPLRLRLGEALSEKVLPRGLAHVRQNPLSEKVFSKRFAVEPHQIHGSQVACALIKQHGEDPRWVLPAARTSPPGRPHLAAHRPATFKPLRQNGRGREAPGGGETTGSTANAPT